jgi:hypothetical protein
VYSHNELIGLQVLAFLPIATHSRALKVHSVPEVADNFSFVHTPI